MSIRRFVPLPGGGVVLDAMQDLLKIILDAVTDNRVGNDRLVMYTLDTGFDTKIFHGLGQPITTWDIVRQNADARVWEGAASAAPNHYFNLTASGLVTVTIRCV